MRKAIGFYWTLPVKWAGFATLDGDAGQAARESRTIALQREVARRWAKEHGVELVEEHAAIESAPDRGTEVLVEDVAALARRAKALGARILLVDFAGALGQRTHHKLNAYIGAHHDLFQLIWPDADHEAAFRAHFGNWREAQAEWSAGKDARTAAARQRARVLQADGWKLDGIAWTLEAEGLRSPTGKPWTADMLRKVLAKPSA